MLLISESYSLSLKDSKTVCTDVLESTHDIIVVAFRNIFWNFIQNFTNGNLDVVKDCQAL